MAPLRRLFTRMREGIGRKSADQCRPQITPTPSSTTTSTSGPRPHTPAVAKPELQPSTTAADPQPDPCIAQPARQPTPDTASPSGLPGRLWTQAYKAVKEDKPRLVDAYETLLRRVLGESDPSGRKQMDQLVREGLEMTKKEAAAKQKIEDGMHIISSVSDLVGTAVKHAPEAAAAWGGVCLLLQVLENPIKEASANRDGMAYVVSRMNWYWALSALLERDQGRVAGLRDELEKHIIDLYKKLLSYQMKSACSCYRSRIAVALRDAVKFDNWTDAVQSLKDAETIVQRDIDTHATQENTIWLGKIANEAELRRTQLQDIHHAIRENTKKHEERRQEEKDEKQEEEDRKCLAWLFATDPWSDKKDIEQRKGNLLDGLHRWILETQSFKTWRDDHQSRLLWVKGDPGKGKTMLLCGIIDELKESIAGNALLSFFFCQGTNSGVNNATAVLRGLIYLLVKQQRSLISHVREKYGPDGKPLFREETARVAMSEILENILHDPNLANTYLIIDALDECETDLPQLLEFIAHNSSASPRVKWIVSSRNRPEIEQQLKLDDSGMKLCLELTENAEHVAYAVSAYIDFKVKEVPSLRDDDKKRGQVRDIICQKANGTFLWVALVIQELKHPDVESWHVLRIVEEVPPSLEDLYSRMIHQMPKRDLDFCRLILSAATLAYRPLSLAELAVLSGLPQEISIKPRRVEKIVAKCGSFLTVRGDYVYLVHQSAKDYLEKKYKSILQPAGPSQGHADIGRRSINAMFSILKRNIYNLDFDSISKDMNPPHPDLLAPVRYSCVFWADHLGSESPECKRELADDGLVFGFLKEHFLHWLESLSLQGKLSHSVLSIRKLLHVVQSQPDISPCLITLLKDAEKFVFSHRPIIERAPLQTYSSALVFSPTMSEVRRIHWKERLSLIKAIVGITDYWGAHRQTLEGHSDSVNAVAFSPDGKTLASASMDTTVRLWDAATGTHRQTLEGHSSGVNAVAFSPDGKTLASASEDKTVRLWDAATGAHQQTLEGHSDWVHAVAFSPDGKTLASASRDETVRLWDAATGAHRQTLEGHSSRVNAVAFSPDGKYLETDRGLISLNSSPDALKAHQSSGLLFVSGEWVARDGKKILWLPPNHRATCVAVYDGILVLGHATGQVIFIYF